MYNALTVARYIVDYCNEHGEGISNLKLQKILYFIQADFLVSQHKPCFFDTIEAWDFGPVVPSVYHQYKKYGSAIIPSHSADLSNILYEKISSKDKVRINAIIQVTKKYSAANLVKITHSQAPWQRAYSRGFNSTISNSSIKTFFER